LYGVREGINYEIDSNNKFISNKFEIDEKEDNIINDNSESEKLNEKEEIASILSKPEKNPGFIQKFKTWLGSLF